MIEKNMKLSNKFNKKLMYVRINFGQTTALILLQVIIVVKY